jgi:hypothetical protein
LHEVIAEEPGEKEEHGNGKAIEEFFSVEVGFIHAPMLIGTRPL